MSKNMEIAIIGLGVRLAGANCPVSFWNNLIGGVDSISEVDDSRWSAQAHYYSGSDRKRSKTKTKWAGFIDEPKVFDPSFFGITPVEAETMDPQQRMLLEVCWNAFEDSRIVKKNLQSASVGVFMGGFTLDYMLQQLGGTDLNAVQPHTATGSMMTLLSNRLSYVFGLNGPSMSIDTACSSSLVATHLACNSLLQGESDIALAGGVNALLTPGYFVAESQAGMLSPTGRSRTFSADADGYVRGEGAGVVVLKRLDDAVRDNDRIYAVIKASGTNQDGNSESLTVPSSDAQISLMRDVYEKAGVETQNVSFVEAHGTGTPVGDPIEANAVGQVMGENRTDQQNNCYIGSVKTNIGHCEAAAGVAGLIKACLSVYHQELPPHLHLTSVNKKIDLEKLRLTIPTAPTKLTLPVDEIYAGVNSFGFGGSNAHVVLQGYKSDDAQLADKAESNDGLMLLPISAESTNSLTQYAQKMNETLRKQSSDQEVMNVLSSTCLYREHHSLRATVFAESGHGLCEQLSSISDREFSHNVFPASVDELKPIREKPAKLVWVFTGMGPQWFAMGNQLYFKEPVFKSAFDRAVSAFDFYTLKLGWSLKDEMFLDEESSNVAQTRVAQTGNFVIQYALSELWKSYGISPDVIVGHSAGEACAALVAGALSFDDAVAVCYYRSIEQQKASGKGKMIAADITVDVAEKLIGEVDADKLSIAAVNSHDSLTIAGSNDAIDRLALKLEEMDTFSKVLRVDIPYHSHVMDELLPAILEGLADIKPMAEHTPLYSTVTGDKIDGTDLDAQYWCDNVRKPVYFADSVSKLLDSGCYAFLEIGPHPVLGASIQKSISVFSESENITIHNSLIAQSLNRKRDEQINIYENLSRLYCAGYQVDWGGVYGQQLNKTKVTAFPLYPWDHKEYWAEPPQNETFRTHSHKHPLLTQRMNTSIPTWNMDMFNDDLDYINAHIVQGSVVFPGSGYIEMFLAASKELYPENTQFEIVNIDLSQALYLQADVKLDIQLTFDESAGAFQVLTNEYGANYSKWNVNSSADLRIRHIHKPDDIDLKSLQERCDLLIEKTELYEHYATLGLEYGVQFQALSCVSLGDGEVLATLDLSEEIKQNLDHYIMHPVMGDMCLQTLASLFIRMQREDRSVFLPVSIDKIVQYAETSNAAFIYNQVIEHTSTQLLCNIHLLDNQGQILLSFEGSRAKAIGAQGGRFVERKAQDHYVIDWQSETELIALKEASEVFPKSVPDVDQTRESNTQPGRWLVFAQEQKTFDLISSELVSRGDQADLVQYGDHALDGAIVMRSTSPSDFSAVFNTISETYSEPPKGIIYLWGASVVNDGLEQDLSAQEIACVSATFTSLLQAAVDFDWAQSGSNIWCVTDSAQSVTLDDAGLNPVQAALWGISRVAGQVEHSEQWGGIVDLDGFAPANIKCLCEKIVNVSEHDQWAIRNGETWLPALRKLTKSATNIKPTFASDVSYFISGGLGALGVITANWLIDCGATHIVLASRRPLPERTQWLTLAPEHPAYDQVRIILDMERRGANITHTALDVADREQLELFAKTHLAQNKPPIKAVYHTAGVAIPELITNLDQDNFDKVLPAKLQGTLNLYRVFGANKLDAFVLFSSLASVVTSSGQASYSAANAFLDSFAHWCKQQGQSGKSINWGPWGEVGMAAELNLVDFFASRGFFAMSNRQGVAALNNISVSDLSQTVVVAADWVLACKAGYPNGEAPSYLVNEFTNAQQTTDGNDDDSGDGNVDFFLDYMELSSRDARLELIQEKLVKLVSDALRMPLEDVSVTSSFASLGLDSMLAIDLRLRIEKAFDLNIAVVDLLKNNPVSDFAAQLYDELEESVLALEQEVLDDMAQTKEAS